MFLHSAFSARISYIYYSEKMFSLFYPSVTVKNGLVRQAFEAPYKTIRMGPPFLILIVI